MINVFISYSHDSETHIEQVVSLATKLMEWGGIDVTLDQWVDFPEKGWTLWMEKQILESDFTLIVNSSVYYNKVIQDAPIGIGKGAKWEGRMIRNLLYGSDSKSKTFVPVLLENGKPVHILTILKDSTYFYAHTEEGFEKLYRYLTTQPARRKPRPKPKAKELLPKDLSNSSSPDPTVESAPETKHPTESQATIPKTPIELIEEGELLQALELLRSQLPSHRQSEIIQLKARLNRLYKQERGGTISTENANITRNQITNAMTSLIEDI